MPWFVDVIELLRYNGAAVVPYNKPRSRAAHGHRKRLSAELRTRDGGSARADLRSPLCELKSSCSNNKPAGRSFSGEPLGS